MAFVVLDPTGAFVTGLFGIAQNDPTPTGYAVIDDADPRLLAWRAKRTAQKQFDKAIAGGLAITWSTSTGLNATYQTDDRAQAILGNEQVYILTNQTFTNKQTSRMWPTLDRGYLLLTVAQFEAMATAVGQYVDSLQSWLVQALAGGTDPIPSNTVSVNA